jgi:acylphosphatase
LRKKRDILKEINCNPMPRLTAFISGMVQKTGYRARVVILANAFGLQGYVQNLPSGILR